MSDKEKVIKAWEIFRDSNPYEICDGREFRAIKEPEYCMGQMIEDTIALLKEQEEVEPEVEVLNEIDRLYRCPRCHKYFFHRKQKYCDQCGQAVKWE